MQRENQKTYDSILSDFAYAFGCMSFCSLHSAGVVDVGHRMELLSFLSQLRNVIDPTRDTTSRAVELVKAQYHLQNVAVSSLRELVESSLYEATAAYAQYREVQMPYENLLGYDGKYDHAQIVADLRRARHELKTVRMGKDGADWQALTEAMIRSYEDLRKIKAIIDSCNTDFDLGKLEERQGEDGKFSP